MTLEELPPVLVLHLKRFVFEKTGGCQKLSKNVDYPVDLEISKGINPACSTRTPRNFLVLTLERQQFTKTSTIKTKYIN